MITEESEDSISVKMHLTINDLYYLFQPGCQNSSEKTLSGFADYTFPRNHEKHSYAVYSTFFEQCNDVLELLKQAQ